MEFNLGQWGRENEGGLASVAIHLRNSHAKAGKSLACAEKLRVFRDNSN